MPDWTGGARRLTPSGVVLQDRATVVLPKQRQKRSTLRTAKLTIVKVLEFSSYTLRSGVVALSKDAPKGSGLLFLRGAPTVIRRLVKPETVPLDFDKVKVQFTAEACNSLSL